MERLAAAAERYSGEPLADAIGSEFFEDDDTIIEQGEPYSDSLKLYFVEEGTVTVHLPNAAGESVEVNRHSEGDFFGEKALTEKVPRAASVSAASDVTLATVDVATFERLLGPCRELMKREYKGVDEV